MECCIFLVDNGVKLWFCFDTAEIYLISCFEYLSKNGCFSWSFSLFLVGVSCLDWKKEVKAEDLVPLSKEKLDSKPNWWRSQKRGIASWNFKGIHKIVSFCVVLWERARERERKIGRERRRKRERERAVSIPFKKFGVLIHFGSGFGSNPKLT